MQYIVCMKAYDTIPAAVLERLKGVGENIRVARIKRKYSAAKLAELAGTNRETLRRIEQGHPGVGIGFVAAVLWALQLEEDLDMLAAPSRDALGMKLSAPEKGSRSRQAKDDAKYDF